MIISQEDLINCIRTARNIANAYELRALNGANDSKRSLDLLIEVCVDSCGHPIEIYKGDFDENDRWLFGACILSPEKATVLYAHYLNSCWERFTVCKELFHAVLDTDEYRSMELFLHIEDITLSFPNDDSTPSKPVACEFLAEVAAMEFLFPYQKRELILKIANIVPKDIAEQYKIPCLMVERYLSTDYMEKLKLSNSHP